MIADMHCHLDLYPDYVRVARDAFTQGIWVLAVTTTPKAWQGTRERLKSFPNIHVAVGLHPELAQQRANELPLLESLVGVTDFIGEVGLDGSPELRKHADIQQQIFRRILYSCAKAGGKVLTIHSRRAVTEVLGCIEERRECGLPILHWFTGSKSELEFAKRLDCWFSVGPQMLRTPVGMNRVSSMPRDRVLLETDGPFGKLNDRILRPAAVQQAIVMLAEIWRISAEDAKLQIQNNQQVIWHSAGLKIP